MSTENKPTSDLHVLATRVQPFFKALEEIAGFESNPTKQNLMAIHASISAMPRLPTLTRLTVDGGSRRDWSTFFSEAVLGYVQEGLAASYYHLANIESIEQQLLSLAKAYWPIIQITEEARIGGGNTRRMNFDYQAFVFALRRTLEYYGSDQVLIAICGGGENLHPWDSKLGVGPRIREEREIAIMALTPVLGDQISRVEKFIFGAYYEMGLLSKP